MCPFEVRDAKDAAYYDVFYNGKRIGGYVATDLGRDGVGTFGIARVLEDPALETELKTHLDEHGFKSLIQEKVVPIVENRHNQNTHPSA